MIETFSDFVVNIDQILASLTVFFPGLLAYFVYVGLRAPEFEEIKRSHLILILFFVLFFQIVQDAVGGIDHWVSLLGFYFVLPVLAGVVADITHRLFVSVLIGKYQEYVIDNISILGLVDVGNVSRWQKTVKQYVEDGLDDVTKEYYIEVDIHSETSSTTTKRGFLNGYSDDDIELMRYDDLANKDFPNIGTLDINDDQLTQTVELIPRSAVSSIRIYRVKMEDFELE